MGKNKKTPKVAEEPAPSKQPKAGPHEAFEQLFPSWRLSRMECVDEFGAWHKLTYDEAHEIRKKLSNFESMTWHEILVRGKKQNHQIRVGDLVPNARKRLSALKLEDLDELVSLHLSSKQRVYGIREKGVLLLLWWDADHAIYHCEKKRT